MPDYDAVVIGSGAGGLAAAVGLARAGQRVLVLEQHYLPGGWCHSFNLEGYRFSPGVHYLGELQPGGWVRRLYEGLGVADDLTFLELNPDGFDRVLIDDERFDIPKGKERYARRLKARFPRESAAIDHYLDTVEALSNEVLQAANSEGLSMLTVPLKVPTVLRHRNTTLKGFLDSTMTDPVLKAILSIQAGDHGVGPARCPLITHALVAAHYFNGGYYPKGGGRSLPRAFVRTLKRHGGEIKLRTRVDRILVEGRGPWRRAVGVRLEDGTEISATTVISNADPHVTYTRMLDQSEVSGRMRKRLARTEYSATGLSLFFAADIDAEAAGLDSSNIWYSQTPSIDSSYTFCERDDLSSDISLPASFLTVTTCKDRSKRSDSIHTMESFTVVGYDAFRKWAHTRFGERPQDYADLKEHLTDAMFANLERFVPGLRERVVFSELGTPLTAEYYAAATRGNFYGTAKTANQIGPWAYPIQTEIRGLLMCGASTLSHGIAGATLSGVHAAAKALGCWPSEVLHGQGQLTLRPCEPEVAGLIESAA